MLGLTWKESTHVFDPSKVICRPSDQNNRVTCVWFSHLVHNKGINPPLDLFSSPHSQWRWHWWRGSADQISLSLRNWLETGYPQNLIHLDTADNDSRSGWMETGCRAARIAHSFSFLILMTAFFFSKMVGSGIQDELAEGLVLSDIKAKMNIPFKSPPGAPCLEMG